MPALEQISKEDVAVAEELGQAAERAMSRIRKRHVREDLMEKCAGEVEDICRKRTHDHEGEDKEVQEIISPLYGTVELGRPKAAEGVRYFLGLLPMCTREAVS